MKHNENVASVVCFNYNGFTKCTTITQNCNTLLQNGTFKPLDLASEICFASQQICFNSRRKTGDLISVFLFLFISCQSTDLSANRFNLCEEMFLLIN